MKPKLIEFLLLYILVPLALIPLYVFKTGEWFALFGILFYYAGLTISIFKQRIFLPIPLFFCFWYWYTYGFSITDYVAFYFGCIISGVIFYEITKAYHKFIDKVLPEQLNNFDYDSKIEELNRRIEKYKKENPGQKITQEIVEKIRTEVFFQ